MLSMIPRRLAGLERLQQLCSLHTGVLARSSEAKAHHEKQEGVKDKLHSTTKGWSEDNASDSEATVKAEKDQHMKIEELQAVSIHIVKEKHHSDETGPTAHPGK